MLARRRLRLHLLDIVREHDAGRRALRDGDTHRPIDHMTRLGRYYNHLYVFVGDVAEQRAQLDLLLIMSAQCGSRLLAPRSRPPIDGRAWRRTGHSRDEWRQDRKSRDTHLLRR